MFSAASVCSFVCQHDNFRTNKHRMMKLGGRCTVQESCPSLNLGVRAPGCTAHPSKIWRSAMTLGKKQCRLSSLQILMLATTNTFISGIVDPPRNRMVKMTMMRVVVTMICLVSRDSRFKCKLSAKDTAPRRPQQHIDTVPLRPT